MLTKSDKYCGSAITVFALISYVSIAAGNVMLGIATLCFFLYLLKNRKTIYIIDKKYYLAITVFIFTMFVSALASGDIGKGLKVWSDLWLWRLMPFFIVTLAIKEAETAKKILVFSIIGITVGGLYLIYQGLVDHIRAAGFFGHPMTFAGYFCIYLPILFISFLEKKISGRWQWLAGCLFILNSVALMFNLTRGAWLAVASVVLLILIYYILKCNKLAVLSLIVLIAFGASISSYPPFIKRLGSITDANYQSNTERILIWHSAFNMFKDHPVTGVGLGQYKDNYQHKYISHKAKEPKLSHAHNNFMQMLAENGIIGFAGFLTLIFCFIFYSFKRFIEENNPYALMMCVSSLALVLQGMTEYNFGNSAVMKSFWLVQGCLLVLSTNWKKSQIARNEDL